MCWFPEYNIVSAGPDSWIKESVEERRMSSGSEDL